MDTFIDILIYLILSPFIAFFLVYPIIFIGEFFVDPPEDKADKWVSNINRIFITLTPLVFIFLVTYEKTLYDNLFKSVNDVYSSVQQFFELLITNYKLGIATTIICFLYPIIIPVSSSISNRYTNGIYMFIFLYSFCFLVLSGIPLNAGFELLESSGLIDKGGLSALFIQLVVGFGPYIIYGIALLVVLIFWIACTTRVLYPTNNFLDKND